MSGKGVLKIVFSGVEGKISNEQFVVTHISDVHQINPFFQIMFPTTGFRIITELSSPEDLPDLESSKLSKEQNHYRTGAANSNGIPELFFFSRERFQRPYQVGCGAGTT